MSVHALFRGDLKEVGAVTERLAGLAVGKNSACVALSVCLFSKHKVIS